MADRRAGDHSLHEVADILGVHYMTVYRYVRQGRLPASRDGLEWRIGAADLAAFRRRGRSTPRGAGRTTVDRRSLERRMVAGDGAGAWWLVEDHLRNGLDGSGVLVRLLVPALHSIGARWADGDLSVIDEHRATAVAQRLVGRLGLQFGWRGKSRGAVALASPPGDLHVLPVAIVADLLRWRGFDVVELGGNTPADVVPVALDGQPRLVAFGVAVSTDGLDDEVAAMVTAAHRSAPLVPVLVGGGAVRDESHARALGADIWPGARPDAPVVAVERLVARDARGASREVA
jgi:excisionase family DNA binding protein